MEAVLADNRQLMAKLEQSERQVREKDAELRRRATAEKEYMARFHQVASDWLPAALRKFKLQDVASIASSSTSGAASAAAVVAAAASATAPDTAAKPEAWTAEEWLI